MPLLCFKARFADGVESGLKTCTIRAHRKYPIKVGDHLYLGTNCRTPRYRRLGEGTCIETWPIMLWHDAVSCVDSKIGITRVVDMDALADLDGFQNKREMAAWFRKEHGLPFEGDFIRWRLKT